MTAPGADRTGTYGTSRGTRAIQAMVEYAPATGGLALWMHHVDVDSDEALTAPVANDGATVYYAPRFEALPLSEQIGWVAHQTLHVAFRHVQRREQLAGVLGDVDADLFNACADALVNSTLSHLDWLQLPKHAVYLDELARRVLKDEQTVETLLLQWDVERLYRAVDDRRQSTRSGSKRQSRERTTAAGSGASRSQGSSEQHAASETTTSGGSQAMADPSGEPGSDSAKGSRQLDGDGPRSAALRALARHAEKDLLAGSAGSRPEAVEETTREWAERLTRGHAADGSFSLLRTLTADVPRTRTPWTQVLRRTLSRGLVREPALSWSRPSRSWLANRGRTRSGRRMPWEPGTVTSKTVPRLVLILDMSGSIDDALLARFGAQLDAITRQLEAQLFLIVGDDAVRFEAQHAPGRSGLKDIPTLAGSGNTNFVPLLEAAARHKPDYAIVLTDLQGPAGTAPGFPVLWAVPREFARATPPYGRLLVLSD